LSHLASNGSSVATARAISDKYHIPPSLLMNILKELAQAGFVRSVRGAKGGYVLAVEPSEITLHELILALEGPIELVRCVDPVNKDGSASCDLMDVCPVSRPVRRVHERLEQFLKEVTLAEIAADACCCGHEARVPLGVTTELRT